MIPPGLQQQVKSYGSTGHDNSIYNSGSYNVSFADFLANNGEFGLASLEAIRLYTRCLPFAQSCDMRAEAFADLTLKIWDRSTGEFAKDQNHPVLALLEHPNSDQTTEEFLTAYSTYSDITGDAFLTVTSMTKDSPPLEIFNELPFQVTPMPSSSIGTRGFAGSYRVDDPYSGQRQYFLDDMGRRFRYFTQDDSGEIWHIRNFNPLRNGNNLHGMSHAQPLLLEIQQYIEGNRTNLSSLLNGVRPSGIFTNLGAKPLTDVQWTRLQEMAAKYTGAQGAGKALAADGIDFKPMQINNRDQEYSVLEQSKYNKIFTRYGVPLPLVSADAQTFANMATANYQFYENAALPNASRLLSELSTFLMRRYPNSENLEVRFDRANVDALRLRAFEEGKELRAIAANSDNEIRTIIGYEAVKDGTGDLIYKPSTLQPAGMDTDTRGNDTTPPTVNTSKFLEALLTTKNHATDECYTMEEAAKILSKMD